ncbi:tRNA (guanine(37)-N1)-methyltransferase Trm5b [Pyrococcus horikoshii]|uniref:tRNA (guanine(37)-N(1))-methyltransferase Trm5b n=2 Tax=Pyrococcus horikoshii TaxID=53953 RepID=O50124_PYRHO|nr:class I SAM-dependent methyltransferase family protein [Pyrococcus horikoshii]BAA30522.1 330aa long hypothetical protein [Pyrococcus horikoshii OT3]HII60412.1 class I SAM-dependent methyltransferase family protein [Pyrococcus horikoshii]
MVLAVKVQIKEGEKVRRKLIELGALNREYKIKREEGFLLIPVKFPVEGFEVVEVELERVETRPNSYKDVVNIPRELRKFLPSSFDIIGNIAIIEIPSELQNYSNEIGGAIIRVHKSVKAVYMKGGSVEGEYRVRNLIHIAGEKITETIHRENGVRLKLDITKVYFSPRLATERMRVFKMAREGEIVFDMFAGVGPFSILLAKKARMVFACDINPWAIKYLEENIKLNKVKNIIPILSDVTKVCVKADRIIMNLPKYASRFLEHAMRCVNNGGIIHYYGFGPEKDPYGWHVKRINEVAGRLGVKVEILGKRIIRNYAPRQYNIAIDFRVSF